MREGAIIQIVEGRVAGREGFTEEVAPQGSQGYELVM